MIDVLIDESNLIKSGAESVLHLSRSALQREDMLVLFRQLLGVAEERLLECLLRGERVFLDEVQPVGGFLAYDVAHG